MRNFFLVVTWLWSASLHAQITGEIQPRQALEQVAEKTNAEIEDDSYWQRLAEYRKHPIGLNNASEEDLQSLGMLTDLQIKNFVRYRNLLGKLISVYELQAIPSWNLEIIRQLIPYVAVDPGGLMENLRDRWRGGDHDFLVRASQTLEKSKGFEMPKEDSASHYLGSQQRIFFRYTYNYKNLLQYGILGDKDAGEQFFKDQQQYGFDFYSFHFFVRRLKGIISSLAIGDFTIHFGQGLIQWQSLAFTKSANVLAIQRQAAVLQPYHSAGEFNFHRGVGLTLKKGFWELTGFVSLRKPTANVAADSNRKQIVITSFDNSGYHRTQGENARRNNIRQFTVGANMNLSKQNWHLGISAIHYYFSDPFQKQNQSYNLFAIQGKHWSDYSMDYSMTCHNFHLFGEMAIDEKKQTAFVQGALISLAANIDAALLYRNISKSYQSMYANAFTESANPGNEKGMYVGITVRPFEGCRIDGFFDVYTFPWLKYQVDAPSFGRDFFLDIFYQPEKKWSLYLRFKNEAKQSNITGGVMPTHSLEISPQKNLRTEIAVSIDRRFVLKSRTECVWLNNKNTSNQQGFLSLVSITCHSRKKNWAANLGLQYFETAGYDSRIYVSEDDVSYSFSTPAYYDNGFRYYFNINTRLNGIFHIRSNGKMRLEGWLRWGQAIYPGKTSIGSGLDSIKGDTRSELKFQVLLSWQKT